MSEPLTGNDRTLLAGAVRGVERRLLTLRNLTESMRRLNATGPHVTLDEGIAQCQADIDAISRRLTGG